MVVYRHRVAGPYEILFLTDNSMGWQLTPIVSKLTINNKQWNNKNFTQMISHYWK